MSKREDRVRELLACADSPLSAEQLNSRKADNEKTFSLEFLLTVPGVRFDSDSKTFKIGPQPSDEERVRRIVRDEMLKFLDPGMVVEATAGHDIEIGQAVSFSSRRGKTVHDWHPGQMGVDPSAPPKLVKTTFMDLTPPFNVSVGNDDLGVLYEEDAVRQQIAALTQPASEPEPEVDFHPTEEQMVAEVEELKSQKALEFALAALCEAAEEIEPPEDSKSAVPTISDEELASLKEQFEADKAPAKNPAQEMALALKNGAIMRLTGEATGRSIRFEMVDGQLMQDGRAVDLAEPRTLAARYVAPLFSENPSFTPGARYELEELF